MKDSNFIPTATKIDVLNYPYGRLRTVLYNSIEFNPKKGYRQVTQTINPKSKVLNKPKKSTYSQLIVRYYEEETNYVKGKHFSMNSFESINNVMEFVGTHFDLFSTEEIQYILREMILHTKVSVQAKVTYCGADFDQIKPLITDVLETLVNALKEPKNIFVGLAFDSVALNNTDVEGFNPFRVVKMN